MSICGIWRTCDGETGDEASLQKMLASRSAADPKNIKTWSDEKAGLALGFSRLEDDAGLDVQTSFFSKDDPRFVFLGEGRFSQSPTFAHDKTLPDLAGNAANGVFPEDMYGGFVMAAIDRKARTLTLGRDSLGARMLYWTKLHNSGAVIFASELQSLLAHPQVRFEIDSTAASVFLALGYVPSPLTICRDIQKLIPGEYLQFQSGESASKSAMMQIKPREVAANDLDDYGRAARKEIIESVTANLPRTGKPGVLLSGGADSTAIVGALRELVGNDFQTFTAGYEQMEKDRAGLTDVTFSQMLAEKLKLNHHEIMIGQNDVSEERILHAVQNMSEPADTLGHMVSASFLFEKARGMGANLVMSGSNAEHNFGSLIWRKGLKSGKIKEDSSRGAVLDYYVESSVSHHSRLGRLLVGAQTDAREKTIEAFDLRWRHMDLEDRYNALCWLMLTASGCERITPLLDRMSASFRIDVRHPFHEPKLFQFSLNIPSVFKGRESEKMYKAVLLKAFDDVIDPTIANRRKVGFLGLNLEAPAVVSLMDCLFAKAALAKSGIFEPEKTVLTVAKAKKKNRGVDRKTLWRILILQLWQEVHHAAATEKRS